MRQASIDPLGHLLRHVHRALADRLADVARSRVQHDPHGVAGVEADFHEVVAAAERAQLAPHARLVEAAHLVHDAQLRPTLLELLHAVLERQRFARSLRIQRLLVEV